MTATDPSGRSTATPFDPWASMLAWQQTWLASIDPQGAGRMLREQRLARLLALARTSSPLYASRSPGARRLQDLAPVSKAELMSRFDEWATDPRITRAGADGFLAGAGSVADAWLGAYLVWTSSGTSGHPGIFVQDAASLAAYDAMEGLRLRGARMPLPMSDPWTAGRRLAYVAATGGPYAGHVSLERLGRLVPAPWAPRITKIPVLLPVAEIAARLQQLQPQWLVTYPSCALALAALQAAGSLALRLDELWLGGEQLTAAQARRLQAAFGCPVRNSYGASEAYAIASGCPHGSLHLNADWVILEPVDADRRPVPPGTLSDLALLTNLANLTQPLLRYELTDRVREVPGACACGNAWPVIEVHGRADDTLLLPAHDGGQVVLLPLVLETVLEEEAGVTDFQLLQRGPSLIELRLGALGTAAADTARRCRHVLQACLRSHGAAGVRVTMGRQAPQREAGSGKVRRVIAHGAGIA